MTHWYWSALSVAALVAASVPSLYFAFKMRESNRAFARISALLAAAFLVHAAFHTLEWVGRPMEEILAVEVLSALLILVFAIYYWRGRGGY